MFLVFPSRKPLLPLHIHPSIHLPTPTPTRLAVFRDDVVFFIYLYQRWIYRVDKTRANEFGYTEEQAEGEEEESEGEDKREGSKSEGKAKKAGAGSGTKSAPAGAAAGSAANGAAGAALGEIEEEAEQEEEREEGQLPAEAAETKKDK